MAKHGKKAVRKFVLRQEDLWCLDEWLAGVIATSVNEFRKDSKGMGYPAKMDFVGYNPQDGNERTDKTGVEIEEEWRDILKGIAAGYRLRAEKMELFMSDEEKAQWESARDAFVEWFNALWS